MFVNMKTNFSFHSDDFLPFLTLTPYFHPQRNYMCLKLAQISAILMIHNRLENTLTMTSKTDGVICDVINDTPADNFQIFRNFTQITTYRFSRVRFFWLKLM